LHGSGKKWKLFLEAVMVMLLSLNYLSIDDKNRIVLPSDFVQQIARKKKRAKLYVKIDTTKKRLLLYPPSFYKKWFKKLESQIATDPTVQEHVMLESANCQIVNIEKRYRRIVLPQKFVKMIKPEKSVGVWGVYNHIQIYSEKTARKLKESLEEKKDLLDRQIYTKTQQQVSQKPSTMTVLQIPQELSQKILSIIAEYPPSGYKKSMG
jgi:division/cell wall cluster transcriptional repressor MraZ